MDTSDRRISVRSGIFAAQADLKVWNCVLKRKYEGKTEAKQITFNITIEITARLESFHVLKLYLDSSGKGGVR